MQYIFSLFTKLLYLSPQPDLQIANLLNGFNSCGHRSIFHYKSQLQSPSNRIRQQKKNGRKAFIVYILLAYINFKNKSN